ncbi:COG4315 family predicted lipoprotein [Haloarchaeobius sp. TZWWS8]|uniref:COG4315 family predicted lipoprotein n=1 Tax=Haloarchaeobius sp. TZWWS8 TaxID=3446121 RepID=UPI003EBF04DC
MTTTDGTETTTDGTETTTDGTETTTDGTETTTDGTETTDPSGENALVQVRSVEQYGGILVDADGMSLYMFDNDTKDSGESACYDSCAGNWPPLLAGSADEQLVAGSDVSASLSSFEREDGERQVSIAGWPLYYYVGDQNPGDVTGQGVGDVWWLLSPDGTPIRD